MSLVLRGWPIASLVCLAMVAYCPGLRAAEPSKLNDTLYSTLKDIHNQGAKLFNAGEPEAAYYLFQGALQTVQPLLSSQPNLQKTIRDGLARAKAEVLMRDRAWTLHELIQNVREQIKPAAIVPHTGEPPVAPPITRPKKPVPVAQKNAGAQSRNDYPVPLWLFLAPWGPGLPIYVP